MLEWDNRAELQTKRRLLTVQSAFMSAANKHFSVVITDSHPTHHPHCTQTPLLQQNNCCRGNPLTSRKCGAFRVNESFRVLTVGGRPLRHSDKGVFRVFMTVWIFFQCYFAATYSITSSGHFYVQPIFYFPVWALYSFFRLLYAIHVKYFHIPKCVSTRFLILPLTI